jgi:hypothetical protein
MLLLVVASIVVKVIPPLQVVPLLLQPLPVLVILEMALCHLMEILGVVLQPVVQMVRLNYAQLVVNGPMLKGV